MYRHNGSRPRPSLLQSTTVLCDNIMVLMQTTWKSALQILLIKTSIEVQHAEFNKEDC